MKLPLIYVLTHDSIGVGEDGPTHEPIEHLAALRVCRALPSFVPQTPRKPQPDGMQPYQKESHGFNP